MPVSTEEYVSKEWTPAVDVQYNTRDLLTYAIGIGCDELNWIYEHNENFQAFPTYPISLTFKGNEQDVVQFPSPIMMQGPKNPPIPGVVVGLDAEKIITKINPLPPGGAKLKMKSKFVGVHKKGSGALAEIEHQIEGEDGTVYYNIISGAFMVGAKDFIDGGKTYSESVKVPDRIPDNVEETFIPKNQAQIFRLSGDYNPLHVDPEFAKMAGFEVPILHGLCTLGHASHVVIKNYCDNSSDNYKQLKLRFASPVLPGQTLVTEMWLTEPTKVVFQVKVKETGKVVINNAWLILEKPFEAKAKAKL